MGCSSPLFIIFIIYPPEQETCGPGSYLLTVESSCFEIMSILISLGVKRAFIVNLHAEPYHATEEYNTCPSTLKCLVSILIDNNRHTCTQ